MLQVYILQDLIEQIPLPKKFEMNQNFILRETYEGNIFQKQKRIQKPLSHLK